MERKELNNLINDMNSIVKNTVVSYQSDFDIDIKLMKRRMLNTGVLKEPADMFLWVVQKMGTNIIFPCNKHETFTFLGFEHSTMKSSIQVLDYHKHDADYYLYCSGVLKKVSYLEARAFYNDFFRYNTIAYKYDTIKFQHNSIKYNYPVYEVYGENGKYYTARKESAHNIESLETYLRESVKYIA